MNSKNHIPKISIVIACYNDPEVTVAIKSAYEQTYASKEIIVVDDGSDERTKAALEAVKQHIDIFITQENSGQSIARNNGIEQATGTYILNLDSDDFFEKDFCEKAVRIFEKEEDVKIVTCKANRFDKKGQIDVFTPAGGYIDNFLFSNAALGSSMFKRKDWEETGGYEEKLPILGFEDWEFYIQLLKNGGRAHVIQETLFNYQLRENSTTCRIRDLRQDKFLCIILKHKELYERNFEGMVENLIQKIKKAESEKHKITTGVDYKLGRAILKPLRYIKSLF